MGKILIKNKKGSHEKPSQPKKIAAATEQNAATAVATNPQDTTNPSPNAQENQGGLDKHESRSDLIQTLASLVPFRCNLHFGYLLKQRGKHLLRRLRSRRTLRSRTRRK